MPESRRILLPPAVLAALASAWMASVGNAPLWRELHALGLLQAQGGAWLALALAALVAVLLYGILSLLAWRRLFKPALLLLLACTAAGAHFMWTYHVVIDSTMASNAVQTDWREARELLTPGLLLTLGLGGIVPAWLVVRAPVAPRPWKQQALRNVLAAGGAVIAFTAIVLLAFQPLASTMRNHKQLRYLLNPLNTLYAAGQLAVGSAHAAGPLAPLGTDARVVAASGERPRLLLLVVGETGRSDRFGLNGYARDTTPALGRAGAVSFRNAWSCGTSTAVSVPCMFSHLGREGYNAREGASENLLDVLRHAGLGVLWIDNQPGGCKGVCDRVPTASTAAAQDPRFCEGGECHDAILLEGLDQRTAALPPQQRRLGVVVVLHQMGSHGPAYAQRTPAGSKRFLPECTSSHLPDCSPEGLRNAYDNTIAYTDHVLGSAIDWLRARDDFAGALLYVADHGESLGENNLYLHGLPYGLAPDVQKHVAWVTWLSAAWENQQHLGMECLRTRADVRITHDNLFHSVLGMMQVATTAYRGDLDAYAPCLAH